MKKYYSIKELLTKSRYILMSVGGRSIGKTYSTLSYLIDDFLKKGNEFIYICRYKTQYPTLNDIFIRVRNDKKFSDVELSQKGRNLFINGEKAGQIVALTEFRNGKNMQFSDSINTILFDEFLVEEGQAYIKGEIDLFVIALVSIFRQRPGCKVIMLSNSTAYNNPYFEFFGLLPDNTKRFNLYKKICVEFPDSNEYYSDEKSDLQELLEGTEFEGVTFNNEFKDITNINVMKLGRYEKSKYTILFEGKKYGIYKNQYINRIIISDKIDPSSPIFSLIVEDLSNNAVYKGWYNSGLIYDLANARNKNELYFESDVIRERSIKFLKKLSIY